MAEAALADKDRIPHDEPAANEHGPNAAVDREAFVRRVVARVMEIGGTQRISDLTAPEGATLLDDPEMVVATVTAPTKVVEPEPTEEELAAMEAEGEEGEGEEGAEGEAAEAASSEE